MRFDFKVFVFLLLFSLSRDLYLYNIAKLFHSPLSTLHDGSALNLDVGVEGQRLDSNASILEQKLAREDVFMQRRCKVFDTYVRQGLTSPQ